MDEGNFQNFIVLVFGCTVLYGAAEMALSEPGNSSEGSHDMLQQSQQLGRLSALSMLLAIFLPSRYRLWSALFAAYSVGVVLLTV